MIVCVCRGVSERAIAEAIDRGAGGIEGIARMTGAGTDCGCCRESLATMVARRVPCSSPPCPGCPRRGAAGQGA